MQFLVVRTTASAIPVNFLVVILSLYLIIHELTKLIFTMSCPEPTPWVGQTLEDHCWPTREPLAWLL